MSRIKQQHTEHTWTKPNENQMNRYRDTVNEELYDLSTSLFLSFANASVSESVKGNEKNPGRIGIFCG